MANLAIVGSHSTNGVAAIHSELLRTTTVKDLAEMFPERFSNKTNGVTPRRWLLLANPSVAGWITSAIGDSWVTDLAELTRLKPLAGDKGCATRIELPSAKPRYASPRGSGQTLGLTVDPESMFDCQVKRIHEYKRQLLNALRVVVLYNRMRSNPQALFAPRTFIFAGKAAPAYQLAKLIIKVHSRSGGPPSTPTRRYAVASRCCFCPSTMCPWRKCSFPRAIVSNQISTGRLRGQRHEQHEVHDERRPDARHPGRRDDRNGGGSGRGELFPLRSHRGGSGRQPKLVQPPLAFRQRSGNARRVGADQLRHFNRAVTGIYAPLIDTLLTNGDHYMHLADLTSLPGCR